MLFFYLGRTALREAAYFIQLIPHDKAIKLVFRATYAVDMPAWLELERGEGVIRSYSLIQAEGAPGILRALANIAPKT